MSILETSPPKWGAVAAGDHLLQIYDDEPAFLDALQWFVDSGLRAGEGVVVIATPRHLHELEIRLRRYWLQVDRARWQDRYIPLLAGEVLGQFMDDGWPDRQRFNRVICEALDRAGRDGRKVRAFGEMVGELMARGQKEATVRLEQLWSELCRQRGLALFCAYPKSCFPPHQADVLADVCREHTRILPHRSAA